MHFSVKCLTVRCIIVITLLTGASLIYQVIQVSHYPEGIHLNNEKPPVILNKISSCDETVHIGLVCTGYKSNIQFHTMLKSLFYYRNSSLHFHILVDQVSEHILTTLFESWSVPQVNVSFYNTNNTISDVRWVPNTHYSGIFGFMKLTFPKIIPNKVTKKIIIIDTDLTFQGNIYELWKMFGNFNESQAIGLVENQSKYYLGKLGKSHPWPALGKGFNTGLMLFRLDKLRSVGWNKLWATIANETSTIFGKTYLADQDVMNTVIKQNSHMLYRLPCSWNVQLSFFTESENCYKNNQIKILHWNTLKKADVNRKDWVEFKEQYIKFNEYDGSLFKELPSNCSLTTNITNESKSVCDTVKKMRMFKWRTLLYFSNYKYTPIQDDVTFVAQLSYDRLSIVEELSVLWEGPISLTFYITDAQLCNCQNFIKSSTVLQKRTNIAYHAVFKEGDIYPINELRNIAVRNVMTPYIFLVDIDFLPTKDSYSIIKRHINSMTNMHKKALVVPAFETKKLKSNQFPQTKENLLEMLKTNIIFPFRFNIWKAGHAPTNFTMWNTADFPYKINWAPNFEPYVIVEKNVTEYDTRFVGFGWNKVAHIMELQAQNYAFIVLPDTYIIHKPHSGSSDVHKFRRSGKYRRCMQIEKNRFKKYLQKKYKFRFK